MKLSPVEEIAIEMLELSDDPRYCRETDIISMIKELPDINMTDRDGRTLLVSAAFYGQKKIAVYLIKNGANINLADKEGFTPLHAAVYSGNADIAKLLLKKGCSVDVKDSYGNTALHRARQTDINMIKLLLDNGADCMVENRSGISAYQMFQAYPQIIRMFDAKSNK